MKWIISYLIKSVPGERKLFSDFVGNDFNFAAKTEQEAIEEAKDYIFQKLQMDGISVQKSDDGLIISAKLKDGIEDRYYDFKAQRVYELIGEDGKPYMSTEPGKLGGHKKLKIYGRLDCPSAARYIAKGQYVKYRVFFADEEIAVAAGYRPCAVCMKEQYKKWKEEQKRRRI